MEGDTEVVVAHSMTAPLNLKRKPQLSVLLSRMAEASPPEKQHLGSADGAAALLVLSGGARQ